MSQLTAFNKTYFEYASERMKALCYALGFGNATDEHIKLLRLLLSPWGDRFIGDVSKWTSYIGDDGTPFEFSVAIDGTQPELRVLLEPLGCLPTAKSNWEVGQALNKCLEEKYGAELSRFNCIQDLFYPETPDAIFSIWHSACFWPKRTPEFKIYLNPQAKGKEQSLSVVEEALSRLGFSQALPLLKKVAVQLRPGNDEIMYFSLDLSTKKKSRVKVYLRHYEANAKDIEEALSIAHSFRSGSVQDLCYTVTGKDNSFCKQPLTTCFSFIEGDTDRPSVGTFYMPISAYVPDDYVAYERIYSYIEKQKLPVSVYRLSVENFATRPLQDRSGMHSYLSFKQDKAGRPRITVYFAPEAYRSHFESLGSGITTSSKPRTYSSKS